MLIVECNIDLVETGYFEVDGEYYCNSDYHIIKGTKCDGCGKFIEGEAVNAINSNFHQECFGCHSCGYVNGLILFKIYMLQVSVKLYASYYYFELRMRHNLL